MDRRGDFQYALGVTPGSIAELKKLKVPIPDQVVYSPASLYYVRTDGTRVGDGFAMLSWIWDVISRENLAILLEPLGGVDYAYVYVKSDKRDGNHALPEEGYSVFYAIMWRPILAGTEGVPIARSSVSYQSVRVQYRVFSEEISYL